MVVPLLQQVSAYYDMLQVDPDFSSQLRQMASDITAAVNENLFDHSSGDHFITQLNADGSTRDFIDYDSNLIAVAFGR